MKLLCGWKDSFTTFKARYLYNIYDQEHINHISIFDYKELLDIIKEHSISAQLDLSVEKREHIIKVETDNDVIETLKTDYMITTNNLKDITASNKAIMINKTLQVSNGFIYDDLGNPVRLNNHKMDRLKELLSELGDNHAIIFYNFKEDRDNILKNIEGSVLYENEQQEKEWNNGNIKYLVLSPFADKYGLNLQKGGHTIIWFGLVWSAESYSQANARVYRTGQTENVDIYYLIGQSGFDNYVLRKLLLKLNEINGFKKLFKQNYKTLF